MYKCYLCDMSSKLNILLSSHYKKAHQLIPKPEYKEELLKFNGRNPKICLICSKNTTIPKGEKEYPAYHRKCYLSNIEGNKNPNYKGSSKINIDILEDHLLKTVDVYILAGPSGCGKSYAAKILADKFNIVDYDSMKFEDCLSVCKKPSNKPYLLVTPMRAKYIIKNLSQSGIHVYACYLREPKEIIEQRILLRNGKITDTLDKRIKRYESLKDKIFQFYGSQEEIIEWLTSHN